MSNLISILIVVSIFSVPANIMIAAQNASIEKDVYLASDIKVAKLTKESQENISTGDDSFVSKNEPIIFENIGKVKLTAYSSTPDQTDDTPFIMASGRYVYDGAIAANFLPLGTKVKFPDLYGDKIFTVEDRMNKRFQDRIDIWMETRSEAWSFGLKLTTVEVVK